MAAFTEEESDAPRLRHVWGCLLILKTGPRVGEAPALERGDIDDENRTVKTAKNMIRVDGKNLVQRTTKTASG